MEPSTRQRVPRHTDEKLNRKIQQELEARLWYYAQHQDLIEERLQELDREWDMERTLQANASSLALTGLSLGTIFSRKFFLIPAVVTTFLLQHAWQGWCPPVPLFRRIGFRTSAEIEAERYALKALRGDFHGVEQAAQEGDQNKRTQELLRVVNL
jgi:hypothetical protein